MKIVRILAAVLFTLVFSTVFTPNIFAKTSYYINSSASKIHRPVYSKPVSYGATAQCRDGEYSFSKHHRGTFSGHGGEAKWLPV